MSNFLGYRSYSSIYQNVVLYGPRPINRTAASGVSKRRKLSRQRSKQKLAQKVSGLKSDVRTTNTRVINGVKTYLVPRGTLDLNSESQSSTKGDLYPTCQPGRTAKLAKQEK